LLVGIAAILALGTCVGYYEYHDLRRDWHLAERGVYSYAWVTHVNRLWATAGNNRHESKCELEGMLPEQLQSKRPEAGKIHALLDHAAATYFESVEPDPERNCNDYLHTWQRVLFDPQDRAQARFAFGYRSPLKVLFERLSLLFLLAILYSGFRLFERRRQHRAAARD
jgi:hypothetical protein